MGVTLDQYRACISLFHSFCVIKWKAYFWATFFHYCFIIALLHYCFFSLLFFSYVFHLTIFTYFLISSVNLVAAEFFFFFYMLYSYSIIMQLWDIEANPRRVGGGAPFPFEIGI